MHVASPRWEFRPTPPTLSRLPWPDHLERRPIIAVLRGTAAPVPVFASVAAIAGRTSPVSKRRWSNLVGFNHAQSASSDFQPRGRSPAESPLLPAWPPPNGLALLSPKGGLVCPPSFDVSRDSIEYLLCLLYFLGFKEPEGK